jgi:phage terminase small subunit
MGVTIKGVPALENESPGKAIERIAKVLRLTEQQRDFVKYYVHNGGQRQKAALQAGYQAHNRELIEDRSNKSPEALAARNTMGVTCNIVMRNPKVKTAIAQYQEVYIQERKNEIEEDVYKIAQLRATYDIRDSIDAMVGYSPEEIAGKIKALPEETAYCIDAVEFKYWGSNTQKFTANIKYADRQRSMEFLSKLTGILVDKKEVHNTGAKTPAINIAVFGGDGSNVKATKQE